MTTTEISLIIVLVILTALFVAALGVIVAPLEAFDQGSFCETNCPYRCDCEPLIRKEDGSC